MAWASASITGVPNRSELGISATRSVCSIKARISASLASASIPSRVGDMLCTNGLTSPVRLHIHLHAFDHHAPLRRLAKDIIAITPANGKQQELTSIEA